MFNYKILSLSLLIVFSVVIAQDAFAHSIENDRLGIDIQYHEGDTIVVSGHIDDVKSKKTLSIHFRDPINNIVSSSMNVPISDDGSYSNETITGGEHWNYSGNYIVNVFYGDKSLPPIEFSYYSNDGVSPVAESSLADEKIKELEKENETLKDRVIFYKNIVNNLEKISCYVPPWLWNEDTPYI